MSSSVKNSIKTKNLHIGYQQKKSVLTIQKNINFQLFKGEFVGILGKNGIGKSTLLRTLTGVQDAISGEVFIQGKNIQSFNLKELSSLLSLVLTERLPESQLRCNFKRYALISSVTRQCQALRGVTSSYEQL